MSKSVVELVRPQITIWRRVTCSISKTTRVQAHALALHTQTRACGHARTEVCVSPPPPSHTHAQKCVIIYNFCFCLTIEVSCSRLSVTLHVHCLSCWPLKTWLWSPFVLLRLFWSLEFFFLSENDISVTATSFTDSPWHSGTSLHGIQRSQFNLCFQ
jgi:hypothetical protein